MQVEKQEWQLLVLENLRLAYKISWKYRDSGMDMDDIQAVAILGLTKAARAFDVEKGYTFATLAVPTITNEINYALRNYRKHRDCVPLELKIPNKEGDTCMLQDLIPTYEKGFEDVENSILIPALLQAVSQRERQIIILAIFNEKSQVDVARIMGISQPQVSRLMRSGVRKMRKKYFSIQKGNAYAN